MEVEKSLVNSQLAKPSVEISATGSQRVEARDDNRVAKTNTAMDYNLGSQNRDKDEEIARRIEIIESTRNEIAAQSNSRLQIDRQEEAGRFIYRLQDMQTGEVMRQWPSESYLELIAFLEEKRGGLVNQQA
jgi:uncharacterized FlaG/YvyC family protein